MRSILSVPIAARRSLQLTSAVIVALVAATTQAAQPYQYGFESISPSASLDWTPYIGSPSPTPSGGGVLGLTAPQGNYYYETVNKPDAAFTGYGASGYGSFGISNSDGDPNFTGNWAQSIQVYIDPVHWAPGPGFAIDSAPGLAGAFVPTLGNGAIPSGGIEYNDETQIQVSVPTAGMVAVSGSPGGPIATITTPGWYTFITEYNQGPGGPTGQVVNNFGVFDDATGKFIGALFNQHPIDNQPPIAPYGSTFQNQMLGGANYVWLVDWANGFANDRLGIDNIQVGPSISLLNTPEPSSITLMGLGVAGIAVVACWRRRKD